MHGRAYFRYRVPNGTSEQLRSDYKRDFPEALKKIDSKDVYKTWANVHQSPVREPLPTPDAFGHIKEDDIKAWLERGKVGVYLGNMLQQLKDEQTTDAFGLESGPEPGYTYIDDMRICNHPYYLLLEGHKVPVNANTQPPAPFIELVVEYDTQIV